MGNQAVLRLLQAHPDDLEARSSTNLQRAAEQVADGALVQRKDSPEAGGSRPKAPSGPRGKGDQEQSWTNPTKRLSTEPALVGMIYFRTKEWSIDAQDETVLVQLAKAYAPWAMRNLGKKGGEQGLRGRIVGYADPRPSVEPNNTELSSSRADIVERRLTRFLERETRLIARNFEFKKEAGGVAPPDPDAATGAEEVSLGWQRRAEIYIAGQASEPEPPAKDAPPPAPVVADPQEYDDAWDRWMPYIEACHPGFARDTAMNILGYLVHSPVRIALRYAGTIPILAPVPGLPSGPLGKQMSSPKAPLGGFTYGKHGGVLPFTPRKPPWWDARTSGYSKPPLHRQALSPKAVKCDELVRKTQMMIRDMRELNTYTDLTVKDEKSALLKFMAELRKDDPDVAKLREYAVPIEYMMFIWDALKDSTLEVERLAEAIEAE